MSIENSPEVPITKRIDYGCAIERKAPKALRIVDAICWVVAWILAIAMLTAPHWWH